MKYIRTKDGRIWEITESDDETGTFVITNYKESYTLSYHDECIYKQADTIEELCDFFDVLWFDEKYEVYLLPKEKCCITILLGYPRNKIREWRFGIRTDKGLIYVAKMNEKGEMELL